MRHAFGDCVLDTGAQELRRKGAPVDLPAHAHELLALLVERRPHPVSRAEIVDRVWPGTFLSPTNVARIVFEVREAIGDDARKPLFLRTVRGFGYAFADGPATTATPKSHYGVLCEDREIPLVAGENLIGRGPEAAIRLEMQKVSRRHACIFVTEESAVLQDLGSKNGTYLGERRIEGAVSLKAGDEVWVGKVCLVVVQSDKSVATETDPGR